MLEDQSYLALWFGWGNLFLISEGKKKNSGIFRMHRQWVCRIPVTSKVRFAARQNSYTICVLHLFHIMYSTCSTSYFKLFSCVANTRPQASFVFVLLIRSNPIRKPTEVNSKTKQNSAQYLNIISMNKETNRGLKILLWDLLGINSILVYLNTV